MRRVLVTLAALVAIAAVAIGALWYRLSSGPIALDFATDWLAAAIKENLGSSYAVEIGGTVLERDENGRTALRIRDIVVKDGEGAVVANAPRAEVGLAGLSLLTGHPRAESLNLVGAALSLRIEPNGDVSVFTGVDKRPLARAPKLASAEALSVIPTRGLTSPAAPPAAPAAAATPSRSSLENLGALLTWLDSVSALGLDGHDLGEIGLKSGSLTVDDQRNGQQSKFDKINLSLTRHEGGEVVLRIGSENTEREWVLLAGVKPLGEGRRAVSIEARKLMMRDLMLAARVDGEPVRGRPAGVAQPARRARARRRAAAGERPALVRPRHDRRRQGSERPSRDRARRGDARLGREPPRARGAVPDRVGRQPLHAGGACRGARASGRARGGSA